MIDYVQCPICYYPINHVEILDRNNILVSVVKDLQDKYNLRLPILCCRCYAIIKYIYEHELHNINEISKFWYDSMIKFGVHPLTEMYDNLLKLLVVFGVI